MYTSQSIRTDYKIRYLFHTATYLYKLRICISLQTFWQRKNTQNKQIIFMCSTTLPVVKIIRGIASAVGEWNVCVWNIGGMVLTVENHIILRRSPGPTLSTTNPLPLPLEWRGIRTRFPRWDARDWQPDLRQALLSHKTPFHIMFIKDGVTVCCFES